MNLVQRTSLLAVVALVSAGASVPAQAATATDPTTLAVEGTLEVVAVDRLGPAARSERFYTVVTDDGAEIPIESVGDAPANGRFVGELAIEGRVATTLKDRDLLPRSGASIDEDSRAGRVAVATAESQSEPLKVVSSTVEAPTAAAAAVPSAHRAYVAVMTNRGTGTAATATVAAETVTASGNYWETESGGVVSDLSVVGSPVSYASQISATDNDTCGTGTRTQLNALWNEAAGRVRASYPTANFDAPGTHLIVAVNSSCLVGIGTVGESLASGGAIVMSLGDGDVQTGVHELGHNFSLGHANFDVCDVAAYCDEGEYYDVFSPMGFAVTGGSPEYQPTALDTAFRARLGLTTADEVSQVGPSGAGSFSYRVLPRGAASGHRGLRVVDPASGATYFVDYRASAGRDVSSFFGRSGSFRFGVNGQLVYSLIYDPGITVSTISASGDLQLQTQRTSSQTDGSFGTGQTFVSPTGAVKIAVGTLRGGSGADVTVQLDAPAPAPVPAPAPPQTFRTKTPKISGTARVGRTLKVKVGSWSPRPSYRYQWYANGRKITKKGTKSSFKLTSAQKGKRMTVKVTARKTGYATVSKTSARTKKVAKR